MKVIVWQPPTAFFELSCIQCNHRIISGELIGVDEYNIKHLYSGSGGAKCFSCAVDNTIQQLLLTNSYALKESLERLIEGQIKGHIDHDSTVHSSIKNILRQWIKEEASNPNGTFSPAP